MTALTPYQRRQNALLGIARRAEAAGRPSACPECGEVRVNAETMRAHRFIAHGVNA